MIRHLILVWGGAIGVALLVAIVLVSCGGDNAAASGPSWLRTIHEGKWENPGAVGKYCDTENGNLVYVYGDNRGGIAVVPGGCK